MTDTPILKNDFVPLVSEAARQLVIVDADGGSSLLLTPDNPASGAVAFISISFDNVRHTSEECISLNMDAATALFDALGCLISERTEAESL